VSHRHGPVRAPVAAELRPGVLDDLGAAWWSDRESKLVHRVSNSATSTAMSGKVCGLAWPPARKMVFEP